MQPTQKPDEVGWLIEHKRIDGTTVWYEKLGHFTAKSENALRFSRERDAKAMIAMLGELFPGQADDLTATEHRWVHMPPFVWRHDPAPADDSDTPRLRDGDLFVAWRPGHDSRTAGEWFIEERVGTTPWVRVRWRHGPGLSNQRPRAQDLLDAARRDLAESFKHCDAIGQRSARALIEARKMIERVLYGLNPGTPDSEEETFGIFKALGALFAEMATTKTEPTPVEQRIEYIERAVASLF